MIKKPNLQKKKNVRISSDVKIGIVVAEFNRDLTNNLEQKCIGTLRDNGVKNRQTEVYYVPGAFEIPLQCQKIAKDVDVIIALGVIIKGDTYHFELVANECARGVMDVMLKTETPIVFEVLAGKKEDMEKRCADDEYNKGIAAANAALLILNNNV